MKKKLFVLSGLFLGLAPVVALAQITTTGSTSGNCDMNNVLGILCRIGQILNAIVPVLIALAVVFFIWGVIGYLISGDEEAKKKGRDRMIYGIIGLAVIVGMWGLVNILARTFNISNTGNITLPTIPVVQ